MNASAFAQAIDLCANYIGTPCGYKPLPVEELSYLSIADDTAYALRHYAQDDPAAGIVFGKHFNWHMQAAADLLRDPRYRSALLVIGVDPVELAKL